MALCFQQTHACVLWWNSGLRCCSLLYCRLDQALGGSEAASNTKVLMLVDVLMGPLFSQTINTSQSNFHHHLSRSMSAKGTIRGFVASKECTQSILSTHFAAVAQQHSCLACYSSRPRQIIYRLISIHPGRVLLSPSGKCTAVCIQFVVSVQSSTPA